MTASAAISEAPREEGTVDLEALRRPTRHRARDAAVVSAIAITQLAWMALLAYGIWLLG